MPDPLDKSAERAKRFYREDPFRASSGNQFSESEAEKNAPRRAGGDSPESPYSVPVGDELPYNPTGYVTTQDHRAGLLLTLAGGGLIFNVFGVVMSFVTGGSHNFPLLPFIGLAATLPAAVLAHLDYEAIRVGAMDPAGATGTWWGRLGGILGTLTTVGFAAYLFVWPWVQVFFSK